MISEFEILNVDPIQITVGSIRDAMSLPPRLKREAAINYILNKIVAGLDTDSSIKLGEFQRQEDPCQSVT